MTLPNLPGPLAREIIKRDTSVISPSYARAYQFVMDHGEGCYAWDVDGNRFLDLNAGIAVNATGHSHPKVVKAICDQAEKFIHISSDFYHPLWVKLGEELNKLAPFTEDAKCFMTNSGTESVEAAIKLARYHTGATQFIGFLGGFHGRTMGSLSFTASKPQYREGFNPVMSGVIHVPYPNPYRPILISDPGEDYGQTVVRYIEDQILGKLVSSKDVAGILVEPIQGEGGYIVPPPGFFPALRSLCDRHDILLIVDEVQSGMGRTGKWWAIEHYGVEPDIICTAKGIASGMPLGAVIAKKSLVDWGLGTHGNTFGGNPLACAAALTTIELIREEYLQNSVEVGNYAKQLLEQIKSRHSIIGEVRGKGLMLGVEFVKDPFTKAPAKDLRDQVVNKAFSLGVLMLGCGVSTIRISPPLCISKSQIDEGFEIFEKAIEIVEDGFEPIYAT